MCFLFGDFVLAQQEDLSRESSAIEGIKSGAGWFAEKTGMVILKGANLVLYAILKFTFLLLAGSMWLLDTMISPEMFKEVFFSDIAKEGINTAWSFVRDFFNLFFILIIVLIGLSTILGVGKFKDKTMLIRVVFAAMLINFSKAITLFIIDASQVFMSFFARAIEDFDYAAQIQNLINFQSIVNFSDIGDDFVFFVAIVMIIIMTLIMSIMLFYLAISLIIRMIAFWVLIILSPMAMFGMAMEGTKIGSLKDDWLENLTKWSFYGPILLFFIWLSIILIAAISGATKEAMTGLSSVSSSSQLDTNAGGLSSFIVELCGLLIPFITAIYLLFYGYDKAMKTSTGAASTILAAGNKKISEWGDRAKNVYKAPIKNTKEVISEGTKTRMENFADQGSWAAKRLTKKGRADIQAKQVAKAKRIIGGDKGESEKAYYQQKAQEQDKKWKDNPPSAEEIKGAWESKDEGKKIAATLYKSQNNQLNSADDYEKALQNLEQHSGLKERVIRETKKENASAVIEHEIKKEGYNTTDPRNHNQIMDVYKKTTGNKNNQEIFKNQNKNFYLDQNGNLKKEVLDFLHARSQGMDQSARRKIADPGMFKDQEVYRALAADQRGQFVLGLRQ